MNLGDFISKLKGLEDLSKSIYIQVGGFDLKPTEFDSYRGYYAELALGFVYDYNLEAVSVEEMIKHSESCLGKTFTGWKGGDFVMSQDTPLWVDNSGLCARMAIVDIKTRKSYQDKEVMWHLIQVKELSD